MPVLFSKSNTDEVKELTLWADDYIVAADAGILPPAALERGFKTYVKAENVQEILSISSLDDYLSAVREHWHDSLTDLVNSSAGYFASVEEAALWLRTTTWTSTYSIEVLIELAKTWAAEIRAAKATLAKMSAPIVQVNGLDTIDEDEDNDASKKRKEAHQKLLGKLRPLPLQYTYTVYHDKYNADNDDYTGRLKVLESNVSDIAAFYQVYNNFPWDKVKLRDTIHVFHQAVKPVWEDPANIDGGSWTFRVGRSRAQEFFHEIALLNVSNEVNYAVAEGTFPLLPLFPLPSPYPSVP
jgi:Eukaryotic initiation factor 4E